MARWVRQGMETCASASPTLRMTAVVSTPSSREKARTGPSAHSQCREPTCKERRSLRSLPRRAKWLIRAWSSPPQG